MNSAVGSWPASRAVGGASTWSRRSRLRLEAGASRASRAAPGLGLAVVVALVATALGRLMPVVGGPVFAIVLRGITALVLRPGERWAAGTEIAAKPVLKASVVVRGTGLSLRQVVSVGGE